MSVQHQGVGVEGGCAPSSMEHKAEHNSLVKNEQKTRVIAYLVTSFIAECHFIALATYIEPRVLHTIIIIITPCHNVELDDSAVTLLKKSDQLRGILRCFAIAWMH